MLCQEKFTQLLHVLGLNFNFKQEKTAFRIIKTSFVMQLHSVFCFFDVLLVGWLFCLKFRSFMNYFLDFIQTVIPFVMHIFVVKQAWKHKELTAKIDLRMNEIDEFLHLDVIVKQSIFKKCSTKVLNNLILLIVTRIVKIILVKSYFGMVYTLATMIPEIMFASNDFYFAFNINLLSCRINFLNNKLLSTKTLDTKLVLEVRKISLKIYNHSKVLMERYSSCLMFSLTQYFVILIINFYWIFIRISFGFASSYKGKYYSWKHVWNL